MSKPLVSILLPCYNVEAYLPQCLDSICRQTYSNLQVVLIDDGSKDGTWNVMQQYAEQDPRLEIYQQENQGVATTRNHLLSKIKGEYTLFVDSDDWIEPDMVEFLITKMMQHEADVVTCGMVKNDSPVKAEYREGCWSQETVIKKFLFHKELNGSLWNKLVKTNLLHGIIFDAAISYGEDALFFWQVIQRVDKLVHTDRQLYHYRMNDDSLSHQPWTPEKKGSGHLVWQKITTDTAQHWPQYKKVAEANFAISDMWQLYFARKSNYPKDEYIKSYQRHIRAKLFLIYGSGIINLKKKIFATVASLSYGTCKILIK